jgi:hypothetical protein
LWFLVTVVLFWKYLHWKGIDAPNPIQKSLAHLVKIATSCIHNIFFPDTPSPFGLSQYNVVKYLASLTHGAQYCMGGRGLIKCGQKLRTFKYILLYKFKDIQGLEFLFSNSRTFKDFQVLYGQCQVWQYFWLGF